MIDLPIGKALVAVLSEVQCNNECVDEKYKCTLDCCKGCIMQKKTLEGFPDSELCGCISCNANDRKDKKHTIFKLVDFKV